MLSQHTVVYCCALYYTVTFEQATDVGAGISTLCTSAHLTVTEQLAHVHPSAKKIPGRRSLKRVSRAKPKTLEISKSYYAILCYMIL